MSEQLLYEADIGSVLVHKCGAGVPKQMTGSLLTDLRGLHVIADKLRQAVRCERLV